MFRSFLALSLLACVATSAHADQSPAPVLALWEFDGWARPTAQKPLGLRFALLEDGRVVFTQDDPASDALLPSQFYQAKLSPEEMRAFAEPLLDVLRQQSSARPSTEAGWTAFYFRDVNGQQKATVVVGHPCLAKGRVFSATAPVPGLRANQNSADRAALSPSMRDACNLLAAFHHASAEPWSPAAVPALLPPQ
jgi:hypothetical protein